jgi:hypothetical protein
LVFKEGKYFLNPNLNLGSSTPYLLILPALCGIGALRADYNNAEGKRTGEKGTGKEQAPLILKKSSKPDDKVAFTYVIEKADLEGNGRKATRKKWKDFFLNLTNTANKLGEKGWKFKTMIYANERTFGKNKVILLFQIPEGCVK